MTLSSPTLRYFRRVWAFAFFSNPIVKESTKGEIVNYRIVGIICGSIVGGILAALREQQRKEQQKRDAEILDYTVKVVMPQEEARVRDHLNQCVENAFNVDLA